MSGSGSSATGPSTVASGGTNGRPTAAHLSAATPLAVFSPGLVAVAARVSALQVIAATFLFGNPGPLSIPTFVPSPVAGIVRFALLATPLAIQRVLALTRPEPLPVEANLVLLVVLLLALLGLARLVLDVRENSRLRLALAAPVPAMAAALRPRLARQQVGGLLRRVAALNAVQAAIERVRRGRDRRLVVAHVGVRHATGRAPERETAFEVDAVAQTLAAALGKHDRVIRYGGDELLCIMPRTDIGRAERSLNATRVRLQRGGLDFEASLAPLEEGDDAGALVERAERNGIRLEAYDGHGNGNGHGHATAVAEADGNGRSLQVT